MTNEDPNRDEISIQRDVMCRGFRVYVSKYTEGKRHVLQGDKFEKDEAFGGPIDSSLMISNDNAQELIDWLWSSGLRPAVSRSITGELAAKDDHIADLRALVFKGKIEPKP